MDKNTQQNAAMVEQATAAAESLTEQARNMAELVRFFQVGDDATQGTERASLTRRGASGNGARTYS